MKNDFNWPFFNFYTETKAIAINPNISSSATGWSYKVENKLATVWIDIPGIDKKNLNVIINGSNLLIKGTSDIPSKSTNLEYILPKDWDLELLTTKLENGILIVTVPLKLTPVTTRKLTVE